MTFNLRSKTVVKGNRGFRLRPLIFLLGIVWFSLNLFGIHQQRSDSQKHKKQQRLGKHSSDARALKQRRKAKHSKKGDKILFSKEASPLSCTSSQLDTIRYQLPPDDCLKGNPWEQKCSFSYASRCPDAIWLTEYYQHLQQQQLPSNSDKRTFVAIYIGCNKGMDAVNMARMGTGNAKIDKNNWRDLYVKGQQPRQKEKFVPGVCRQDGDEQFQISSNTSAPHAEPIIYCVEAMPVSASKLRDTAQQLGWDNWFQVQNVAMSDTNGVLKFPHRDAMVGVENRGASACVGNLTRAKCKEVPSLRLDTYSQTYGILSATTTNKGNSQDQDPAGLTIDVLSVDVEGYDWTVLSSGPETLQRTKYLEFEYNWMGPWQKQSLRNSIVSLQQQGFVCYWAGRNRHVWRITECWQDYYDKKFWSNVACVKPELHPDVAVRMERMFLATLSLNRTIRYNTTLS